MAERRRPLSRERVVAEAVALADADGLDAVSMRALATRLDVVPMALYKHVADKEDLLDAMVEAVVASYADPPEGADWRASLRARVLAARDELGSHPWLRRAIETRARRTEAVLAHMDAAAGDLVAGGFTIDQVHHLMHVLGHRLWGFSPEAFAGEPTAIAPGADLEAVLAAAEQRFPHVVAITRDAMARRPGGSCDEGAELELALDLFLDGAARLRDTGWASG